MRVRIVALADKPVHWREIDAGARSGEELRGKVAAVHRHIGVHTYDAKGEVVREWREPPTDDRGE